MHSSLKPKTSTLPAVLSLSFESPGSNKGRPTTENVRSAITRVTANTAGVVGIRANGFTTPRSRGRSEIYHMVPTLYSRLRQTTDQMASSSTCSAYNRASLFESVWKHDRYFGSKQKSPAIQRWTTTNGECRSNNDKLPISNNQGHINSSDFVGNCDTLQSGTAEAVICNSKLISS
ncbi:hypothetical protein P3L10_009467 [Capsicum annuum]